MKVMSRNTISTVTKTFPRIISNGNSNLLLPKVNFLENYCSSMKHLYQVHAQIQVSGLHNDPTILCHVIRFCSLNPLGSLNYARIVIEYYDHTVLSSWNSLIRGNAIRNRSPREAVMVFIAMRARGIGPDELTYPSLFKACSSMRDLREGRQIHLDVLKRGLGSDLYVNNTLIHFYGVCGEINDALNLFDEMPVRDIVSWNSAIGACVENSRFCDSIGLFCRMITCGFEPNETSMVGLLSACAETGNLGLGKWVHSRVIVTSLCVNCELGTSLVNMYAKCGDICFSRGVFDKMTVKNVLTWSAMILGLAQHGFALDALEYFEEMKRFNIKPNYVTFLGVLCACSHPQLVKKGLRFFEEMSHIYGIKPGLIHYGAMVDCLSRGGHLREAYNFAKNMPIKPDAVIWRTILSACYIHDVYDYTGVAGEAREKLLELEPKRSGNYIMIANKYAEIGMWETVDYLRSGIRDRGLKKMAGESWVQIGSSLCRFISGDNCEDSHEGIDFLLVRLNLHMKKVTDELLLI